MNPNLMIKSQKSALARLGGGMRVTCGRMLVRSVATVLLATTGLAGAGTVTPLGLNESRSVALNNSYSPFPSNLKVLVRIAGEDLKGAAGVGKIKISEAKDDAGKQLDKAPFGSKNDTIKKIGEWDISKTDGSFLYEFSVGAPAREAKKLTLKAEVTVLAGGEIKEVKFPFAGPAETINDETLKAAGLTIKRKAVNSVPNWGDTPPYEIEGSPDVISKLKMVAKDGKPFDANYRVFQDSATKATMLSINPFGESKDASVSLLVVVGQKEIKLPVELNEVNLP